LELRQYGINAVFLENYENAGPFQPEERTSTISLSQRADRLELACSF